MEQLRRHAELDLTSIKAQATHLKAFSSLHAMSTVNVLCVAIANGVDAMKN